MMELSGIVYTRLPIDYKIQLLNCLLDGRYADFAVIAGCGLNVSYRTLGSS